MAVNLLQGAFGHPCPICKCQESPTRSANISLPPAEDQAAYIPQDESDTLKGLFSSLLQKAKLQDFTSINAKLSALELSDMLYLTKTSL